MGKWGNSQPDLSQVLKTFGQTIYLIFTSLIFMFFGMSAFDAVRPLEVNLMSVALVVPRHAVGFTQNHTATHIPHNDT